MPPLPPFTTTIANFQENRQQRSHHPAARSLRGFWSAANLVSVLNTTIVPFGRLSAVPRELCHPIPIIWPSGLVCLVVPPSVGWLIICEVSSFVREWHGVASHAPKYRYENSLPSVLLCCVWFPSKWTSDWIFYHVPGLIECATVARVLRSTFEQELSSILLDTIFIQKQSLFEHS